MPHLVGSLVGRPLLVRAVEEHAGLGEVGEEQGVERGRDGRAVLREHWGRRLEWVGAARGEKKRGSRSRRLACSSRVMCVLATPLFSYVRTLTMVITSGVSSTMVAVSVKLQQKYRG